MSELRMLEFDGPSTALTAGMQHASCSRYCNCTAATGGVSDDSWYWLRMTAQRNLNAVQNTDDGDSIDLDSRWGMEGLKTAGAYNAAAPQETGDPSD